MHEIICMIVLNENQMWLLNSIMNHSSIAHLFEPSPLKFSKISKKIGLFIYIGFNMKYLRQK